MDKPVFSQTELLAALMGTDAERRKNAMRCLFDDPQLRQSAIGHVRRHGGNRQDGEDMFQEAILLFDRKVRAGAFQGQGSLEAYFMGIVRWHWYNECQRNGHVKPTESPPELPFDDNPEQHYLRAERRAELGKLLEQLTEKCKKILKLYQLDYTMEEIAKAMGYANAGVAKKEAFLCRQRFLALLKKHANKEWMD